MLTFTCSCGGVDSGNQGTSGGLIANAEGHLLGENAQ